MLIGVSSAASSVFSLLPITCVELFGKENLQSALAINFVYQGVAHIVYAFGAGEFLYCK